MTIEDDISFFERVPTLNLLSRAALRILAIGAQSRYVHGGEILFNAADRGDGAFVVQEGRFQLSSRGAANDDDAIVVGPFSLLGETALLTDCKRPATATALEPATVLFIPRPLFLKMLANFPDSARKLRDIFATRLSESTREMSAVRAVLDGYDHE